MLILIIGGSASGKSEFAESLCLKLGREKLYIATMQPFDDECKRRIEKHQQMRRTKGFSTLEVYRDFGAIQFQGGFDLVLIECMSNALANEIYCENPQNLDVCAAILQGIDHVAKGAENTVLVSNEVFCDGDSYDKDTLAYMEMLGKINAAIALKADIVIEVVCGIPLYHKGGIIA